MGTTTILENLEVNEVSLVTRGANPGAKIALFKAENNEEILAMEELQKQLEELQKQLDEKTTAFEKLTSDIEGITTENDELKKAAEKPEPVEDIKKDMPDDVRKEFEALQKSAEDQKAQIEKMRDEQLTKEVTEVVKTFDQVVTEDTEGVVGILKSLDEDHRNTLVEIFKKAENAIEAVGKGLLSEQGEGALHDNEDSPADALEKAAQALMEKDGLAHDAAVSKAIKLQPELYHNTRKNAGGK